MYSSFWNSSSDGVTIAPYFPATTIKTLIFCLEVIFNGPVILDHRIMTLSFISSKYISQIPWILQSDWVGDGSVFLPKVALLLSM